MDLYKSLLKMVDNSINSRIFTDLTIGTVESIDPLEIAIMDGGPVLNESSLLLTESVIRKEIRIKPHLHYFEEDHFKHNHGSPLQFPKSVEVKGSITNVLMAPCGVGGSFPVSGNSTWEQTSGKVEFDEGSKDIDLSDSGDEIVTKLNRKSTEDTLVVRINGKDIPLVEDDENETEEDDKDSPVMWGVLSEGLRTGDGVLLLQVKGGFKYIVLSKIYNGYYYRDD